MMKILFYNHTGQVSGAEHVLLTILEHQPQTPQYRFVLCCPPATPLSLLAQALGVECLPLPEWRARFTWRPDLLWRYGRSFAQLLRLFRKTVSAQQPDLIHANSVRAGLVASVATMGLPVPVLWHVHDVLPRHPLSIAIRAVSFARKDNHILAVSRAAARRFESAVWSRVSRRPPVRVIHNGVATQRFFPDPDKRRALRAELGYTDKDFLIGVIGQLTPRKGQLELIEAFAAVARQAPHAHLLLVGAPLFPHDHAYLAQLQQRVRRLKLIEQVLLLGARQDVPAVLQALDLKVLNSRSDPFPLTLLEAMACGVPVLATAVDGIPELLTHRETGWLVPPHDQAALTQGLRALLQQPALRATLAERGHKHVHAGFTREKFLGAVLGYYRELSGVSWWVTGRAARLE